MTDVTARPPHQPRLPLLDAIRGIAALSVAWFHFYYLTPLHSPLLSVLPGWVDILLRHGDLGVPVFFVLSGFVIALSVGEARITAGYVGRFALRRSIRLDPPYWITLAIGSILLAVAHRPISLPQVAAHVVYLQGILGYPQIVSMFWTLSYEIQFYLVFVLMVWLAQRYGRSAGIALAAVSMILSLTLKVLALGTHGVFLDWWYAFGLGVGTFWLIARRISFATWAAGIVVSAVCACVPLVRGDPAPMAVVVSAGVIGTLGLTGALAKWSGGPVLRHLGRISYSLYLIHFFGNTLAKYGGDRHPGPAEAAGWFLLSTAVSVAMAHLLHVTIENPAHQMSRRVGKLTAAGPIAWRTIFSANVPDVV
jgi:hypothetical protein